MRRTRQLFLPPIALHPKTPNTPDPGTRGSVTLGLVVDEPIDTVVSRLVQRGVRVTARSEKDRSVDIEDLDGNVITLWDAHTLRAEVWRDTAAAAATSV